MAPESDARQRRAAERVDQWLLHGPAQLRDGIHAGAVAGSLSADARPLYVYPEITGYYLQWLAWRASALDATVLAPPAARAQEWLGRWAAADRPLTRVHLQAIDDDWRNHAVFTFDVAMALRGIASAVGAHLIAPDPVTLGRLCALLATLVGSDGSFEACRAHDDASLPHRWSTRRGGYLAKAAAGILRAAEQLSHIPDDITAAAERTFDAAMDWTIDLPHDDVHPFLYAYEGVLSCATRASVIRNVPRLVREVEALAALTRECDGVPELRSVPTSKRRNDVLAQAIRLGELWPLVIGTSAPFDVAPLRARLAEQVRAGAGVPFACDDRTTHNVWAAMFASQALHGFAAVARDRDPLIV